MNFDMYMEKEIPGYKSLIPEEVLKDLKSAYETMNNWKKTRDFCNEKIKQGTSSLSWQNDFDKADRALESSTGDFYNKILKVKENLGLLSKEEENTVSYK